MGCVLSVRDANLDVDACLHACQFVPSPYRVSRREEVILNRICEHSGFAVKVSHADFGDFDQQISDAIEFLRANFDALTNLEDFPNVEFCLLDFPIVAEFLQIMPDLIPADYAQFFDDLKNRIRTAQVRATLAVNSELIALYFDVGRLLVEKQETLNWGDGVVAQLARDLKAEFPQLTGFSRSKLFEMRQFFWPTAKSAQLSHKLWDKFPGATICCCTN